MGFRRVVLSQERNPEQRSATAWLVAGLLLTAVFVVFGRTGSHGFIHFDDGDYVYKNPKVRRGLSVEGIVWAFQSVHASNWHPLTWLSHMADCQVYGLKAGGHHLTNVMLHGASTILLFWLLRRLTNDLWPSALAAAAFAVHPLHVESVAWVAERKDVLSGLLFMATLAAYARYAPAPFAWGRYLVVAGCFGLGLLAKPMLVTLPAVLGLLDVWPLARKDWRRAVLEKIPLAAMSAASCAMTLVAQREAIRSIPAWPLSLRLENAVVSVAVYLGDFLVPIDLAVFYPYPEKGLPILAVAAAALLLAVLSAAVWLRRRQEPYLLVGWLWFLGMLVPVVGLVQVGEQARADRYMYLPQIGLGILLAWGGRRLARWAGSGNWPWLVSAGLIALWIVLASQQVAYWRNSETLWNHALRCTGNGCIVHYNLAQVMREEGRTNEAIEHYRKALESRPDFAFAHANLGLVLHHAGRDDEAIAHLRQAIEIDPQYVGARNNLGIVLVDLRRFDDGIEEFRKAIAVQPEDAGAHANLANTLILRGDVEEAMDHYREALRLAPDSSSAHYNYGVALVRQGRTDEAIAQYRKALALNPDDGKVRRSLDALLRR